MRLFLIWWNSGAKLKITNACAPMVLSIHTCNIVKLEFYQYQIRVILLNSMLAKVSTSLTENGILALTQWAQSCPWHSLEHEPEPVEQQLYSTLPAQWPGEAAGEGAEPQSWRSSRCPVGHQRQRQWSHSEEGCQTVHGKKNFNSDNKSLMHCAMMLIPSGFSKLSMHELKPFKFLQVNLSTTAF